MGQADPLEMYVSQLDMVLSIFKSVGSREKTHGRWKILEQGRDLERDASRVVSRERQQAVCHQELSGGKSVPD